MIVFTEMFEVSIGDFYVVVKTIKIVILGPEVENPCPMPDYHGGSTAHDASAVLLHIENISFCKYMADGDVDDIIGRSPSV